MCIKGSSFVVYILAVTYINMVGADTLSGVLPVENTTLQMVCDRCLILSKELLVPIIFVLAVNALSLQKRKTSLLKRLA